jgi:hypothetical protein
MAAKQADRTATRKTAHRLAWRRMLLAALLALAVVGGARAQFQVPASPPASSPWDAHIREAAGRFGVPEVWIREVMRLESGGSARAISHAGAMGLMQVMPGTYAMLRWQHGLGPDPYDPRDNILAGAAYIREMYDLFGFPAFLAAYNAGPDRVDRFLNRSSMLPAETVNYLAMLAPRLEGTTTAEGPLSVFLRNPAATEALGGKAQVIDIQRALVAMQAAPPPTPGPQVVKLFSARLTPPAPFTSGLVPRGMLAGPQVVQMPKATDGVPPPAPVPPAMLSSLRRAMAR